MNKQLFRVRVIYRISPRSDLIIGYVGRKEHKNLSFIINNPFSGGHWYLSEISKILEWLEQCSCKIEEIKIEEATS